MKDSVFKNKIKLSIITISITLLIFTPLYYSVNSFFISSANEIINSWYQSERTNIQQGNILSSISKLQRPINNSTLLKGIIVKDENGHDLLKIGRDFKIEQNNYLSSHEPQYTKAGFSNYIYYFSESGITVFILVSSYLPYVITIGFAFYLIILFFIFGYFVRRESIILENIKNAEERFTMRLKIEMDEKLLTLSQQVVHDIRSPLAALNIISGKIKSFNNDTDEMNKIFDNSIKRINDISNDLLIQHKNKNDTYATRKTSLIKLIKDIVAEKNIILLDKGMFPITFDEKHFLNVFIDIIPQEFESIFSNLINNSIEAIDRRAGLIGIVGEFENGFILIKFCDNGIGISPINLSKLGNRGISLGKNDIRESGSGLGLYHAKKTLETSGGSLTIESEENKGTNIILKLPCEIIVLTNNEPPPRQLILFEDDELVIMSWNFKAKKMGIDLFSYSSFEEFTKANNIIPFDYCIPIYSDVNLSPTESGHSVVTKLNTLGFNNIHFSTGYNRNSIIVPDFIKSVIDKNFPIKL